MMNNEKIKLLPSLEKWRDCSNECYGCAEPFYIFDETNVLFDNESKIDSARLERRLFTLSWTGTLKINGKIYKFKKNKTPEDALNKINDFLLRKKERESANKNEL